MPLGVPVPSGAIGFLPLLSARGALLGLPRCPPGVPLPILRAAGWGANPHPLGVPWGAQSSTSSVCARGSSPGGCGVQKGGYGGLWAVGSSAALYLSFPKSTTARPESDPHPGAPHSSRPTGPPSALR